MISIDQIEIKFEYFENAFVEIFEENQIDPSNIQDLKQYREELKELFDEFSEFEYRYKHEIFNVYRMSEQCEMIRLMLTDPFKELSLNK